MLEGLVAWVLNNYLGKYVENLNTDQLSVALLSGKVELENLPLKKDALRYLGLPVEIKAGFIGKVQLQVPVRQIRSAPWLIAIEKLYLVAAPVNLDEWDSAVEASIAHERKMALLDALEAQWRAEHEASDAGYYAASYSSWLSYGTGLLANIVENLQLKLNDVHIRYEDALTCGSAFAAGLAVESLTAESCDASWCRGFTSVTEPCSFKLLELHNLALYWDPMPVPAGMMADCTIAELTERMRATWGGAHRYVLAPTTASARVRRERCEQPLRDRDRPRLAAHLTLDLVQLRLSERQYSEMAGCARGLERIARLRELRALRPERPVRGHARDWWRYAVRAHLPHHTWMDPRPTWATCLERARRAREYVDTCLQVFSQPAGTLPTERQAAKDEFEWRAPLPVLKALREVAIRRVPAAPAPHAPPSSGRGVLVRWFPQWWGWYAAPPDEPRPPSPTATTAAAVTSTAASRLEDEILDVIADSLDDNTLLRRDALFGLFEFTLSKGSLDLYTESDEVSSAVGAAGAEGAEGAEGEGLELQFSGVSARVESRPRAGAHALHVALGGVRLRSRVTPRSLFPVLVAPQGLIRAGLSAAARRAPRPQPPPPPAADEPLFQLSYEKRPAGLNCDYKLRVKSQSLEVVWCAAAARWARRWVEAGAMAHVRLHTRATLHHHWDRLLHHTRRPTERRSWQIELDISAPQILFVEDLCDSDASVLVVDFGRLKLANANLPDTETSTLKQQSQDDDEEMFMTPCSTPPGSLLSPASPPASPPAQPALHQYLRTSLYDRYKIELSDLQILVGRARDNWKYAHTKSTSALHLLDRFSISLQAERRVVATSEPQYPRLALCGSLPALVAHLSEHKLAAVRAVLARAAPQASAQHDTSPSHERVQEEEEEDSNDNTETEFSDFSVNQNATLLMLQFAIDQMSLEVQSRGRSIAEVQVCGVRAALGVRAADTSLALSVHSLLLVDALQTYGPDFELLVASHRHVGMDTASGSIRGSEPTSPTSPASPDARASLPPPTPLALHRAVSSLHSATTGQATSYPEPAPTSPTPSWLNGPAWNSTSYGTAGSTWGTSSSAWGPAGTGWGAEGVAWGNTGGWGAPGLVDSEALIAVELCFVKGDGDSEDLRIANILFNNLDVIANQETIVELIGFAHRVAGAPARRTQPPPAAPAADTDADADGDADGDDLAPTKRVRTEITFDFHRLGVLLLRAGVRDGALAASKIATATVGDARIQATLDGDRIEVGGSLGGVQVVSLSERAGVHSRVLAAGRAPAAPHPHHPHHPHHSHHPHHPHHPPRALDHSTSEEKALLFTVSRTIRLARPEDSKAADGAPAGAEAAEVVEVQASLRVASVWYTHSGPLLRELQSCVAEFQQYLANLARSIRAAAADMAIGLVHPRSESLYANPRLSQSIEGVSPRRRTTSVGYSLDEPDRDCRQIVLSVTVELESPVVVVPRSARSPEVFVAHLGRMSLANRPGAPSDTIYSIRIRDISLVSLDVSDKISKRHMSTATDNLADIYDVSCGLPVLHDTALQLAVAFCQLEDGPRCTLDGRVVDGLHVSASREQYEQLLDTLQWLADSAPADVAGGPASAAPASEPHEVLWESRSIGLHVSASREQYEQLLDTLQWLADSAPADVAGGPASAAPASEPHEVLWESRSIGLHVSASREQYEQLLDTLQWLADSAPADVAGGPASAAPASEPHEVLWESRSIGLHVSASREQYEQLLDTLQWLADSAPADVAGGPASAAPASEPHEVLWESRSIGLHVSASREQYEQLLDTLQWLADSAPADVAGGPASAAPASEPHEVLWESRSIGLHVSASREQYEQLLDTLQWLADSAPADVAGGPASAAPASEPHEVLWESRSIGLHVSASREQYEQLLDTLQWLADSAPADVAGGPASAAPASEPHEVLWESRSIGLHVSASREQYEQLLDTLQWLADSAPADVAGGPASAAPASEPHQPGSVVDPAVPTLRLDPQLRAAVLAVPPPSHAPAHTHSHTPLVVTFELATFTVELRADVGAGERSLVALTFREFSLRSERLHPHESTLQVSLHSITMEDLTKDPESKHRMLMVSHTPPMPPKAVFVSKSCPDFVTAFPGEMAGALHRALPRSTSLPNELNVVDRVPGREYKRKKEDKQENRCPTPPSSPQHDAPRTTRPEPPKRPERPERPERPAGPARDDLVWVHVHTRHPSHPRFTDLYDKVSRVTKVEFNCLKLVLSIDSWVAVLDFFGIAGDEPDQSSTATDSNKTNSAADSSSEAAASSEGATETEMDVRSLSVVVVGARGDACRALVSRVRVRVRDEARAGGRDVRATLGALALADLAPRAGLWRERLRMRTSHALDVHYRRLSAAEAAEAGHETSLSLEMGPATYVHTRRFVLELQAFARDFSLLRRVIAQARRKVTSSARDSSQPQRMRLRVRCAAPVIVLPVSGRSRDALAAELQLLQLDNRFCRAGDPGTVSKLVDPGRAERPVLDVRSVRAEGLSLWAARSGGRRGPPLLPAPVALALQLERNCGDSHNVAEMTVQGRLATLRLSLDAAQYRLVRGVLAHNLGEACDELLAPPPAPAPAPAPVWPTWSLQLDLQDVCVELRGPRGAPPLACINFIKSRLLLESYSDLSQDIDLVSQEILVSDTRYAGEPANRRGNVFSHIVQPMPDHRHSVQAEVHARKRPESSAYTILINNMRLMAILDWWEAANQFIMQPPPPPADPDLQHLEDAAVESRGEAPDDAAAGTVELKLNITDSQLVLVEDASLWDTNAVILKSTTVITYRPADEARPVLCELNELELFSCVLGLEEETALAIVEPAALHAALRSDAVLHVAMGTLNLRLSYHDMRMFASMLQSLPEQARAALSGKSEEEPTDAPANSVHMRSAAGAPYAGGRPRWLKSAPPARAPVPDKPSFWPLKAVQVDAECVTLCVIDDCLDSDVPLLEVSLNDLLVEQDLRKVEESFEDPLLVSTPSSAAGALAIPGVTAEGRGGSEEGEGRVGAGGGRLRAQLSVDYYNRTLSDWEPVIEPWRFSSRWEHTLSSGLALARLQLDVRSADTLDTNLTSALVDLARLVRTNWTADYYAPQTLTAEQSPKSSPSGHRRRSPFVPYALRNLTGQRLWFTTLTTTSDELRENGSGTRHGPPDDSWVMVRAGDTEPFSFGARRGRGRDAPHAPAPLHRLVLSVDGWAPPDPVCVDRVGVFFRHITHAKSEAEARLVLEVSLEGSARKLVTVRSALQLLNKLPHPVELRLDRAPAGPAGPWSGGAARSTQVAAGARWAAPLAARAGAVWARPLLRANTAPAPLPAPAPIDWRAAAAASERALLHVECRAPHDYVYRFCCAIVRERFPPDRGELLAGHTLTLVPALRLENLLPLELQYRADAVSGTLAPAATQPFHQVNVEEGVELCVKLEGFGWSTPLSVGGAVGAGSFSARLKLRDQRGRRLYLNARITVKKTDGIKVSVSAAYWLVNRTGLPLVFRAEGGGEAAGQFAEHELARMVAPLPFAFADGDGPTVSARLGASLAGSAEWCSPFGLGPGVTVKKLESRGGEAERAFAVGVSVRAGRGRYRRTNIVTLTPRYQLHNNTPHRLQFAQKCTATTLNDPGAIATHVSAVAGCYLPWHWARWDREQLLCVRVLAEPEPQHAGPRPLTAWSGGFRIDTPRSLHVACRESGGSYQLVRVEVVAQGAALLVVLSAARGEPPPLRIDNFSPVAIMFHQVGCAEECVVSAGGRACWALPEPEGAPALALRAPGGPRLALSLAALHEEHTLLYQNFIYVAFAATATGSHNGDSMQEGGAGEDEGVLVLEVPLGSTRVQLARKRYGDRSQLWRRGPGSQLLHEGSSPPQPTDALSDDCTLSPHAMVLDIEEAAPRPGRAAALVLRRADPRRASTQAWRLVPAERAPAQRMACAHANLCVQPENGLMGLQPGGRVVLGMAGAWRGAVPPEQAVQWRTLRPGSGRLAVALSADGPTRCVRIRDRADPAPAEEPAPAEAEGAREWGLAVSLAGVSLSLVARWPPAELLFAQFTRLRLTVACASHSAQLALSVDSMQWDNQLTSAPSPVLLYCLEGGGALPALHVSLQLTRAPPHYNALYFSHLVVALRPVAVRLDERLVLLVWAWAEGGADSAPALEEPDEAEFETRRVLHELTALHAPRYYFALIKIIPSQVRLSMFTANKLEGELGALKRRLGLTFIRFEDAAVELEPFVRAHVFDTAAGLARQLLQHFKDELKWQAAKILGSVDFLGNPLGFVADVSEGVSGLLLEGNVGALFKNVTHGISNSAAKVTETLGDGLERVVGDEAHEETRRRIRSAAAGSHLAAGFRGLGLGILGGMTSLVKHSYEGAAAEGVAGFLAGVGKGLVGTVTKPVIGVLDLAAETAAALRETSRRAGGAPRRLRAPRLAAGGAGGAAGAAPLPRYCPALAEGAALLLALPAREPDERFVAYRTIRDTPHDIRALLSDAYLRIVTCKHGAPQVVMETQLGNLVSCAALQAGGAWFVELGVRGAGVEALRRPRVQCDSAELAAWLARHAAAARQLHHDRRHTLLPHTDL